MAEETLDNAFRRAEDERVRERDLGFGSVVAEKSRQRLINQDGTFNVERTGLGTLSSINLYHTLLSLSWRTFLGLLLLLYFLSNVLFGIVYASFGPEALVDSSTIPTENLFIRGFFFSVQTFATIGYGTIHPVGIVPNLIVTIESYYSLIANALITGVIFARFAKPSAKVWFSKVAVVAPYNGIAGLMFRLVNGRSNQLLQVGAQVMFARFVDENGKTVRRFDLLELERKTIAFFPLSWTIVHPIDENSPLFGLTQDDLRESNAEILVLLTATDETFAAVVHTRSSYKWQEVKFDHRFVSIYNEARTGEPISIDVRKLSATEPAAVRVPEA